MMHYRTLGRTGLQVSEIGYGAWGISGSGWIGAQDQESLQALQRAIDLGVNFIDTALAYGEGHSERVIAQVLRDNPDKQIFVASKIPPKNGLWPAPAGVPVEEAFPGPYIQACTEQSLRNLGTETLDIQQFHVWNDEWVGQGDWAETIQRLKEQGKIRFFVVSINDLEPSRCLNRDSRHAHPSQCGTQHRCRRWERTPTRASPEAEAAPLGTGLLCLAGVGLHKRRAEWSGETVQSAANAS